MAWLESLRQRRQVDRHRAAFRLHRPERDALHRRRLSAARGYADHGNRFGDAEARRRRRFGSGPLSPPGATTSSGPLPRSVTPAQSDERGERRGAVHRRSAVVVGAPTLTLSYTGTTPAGVRPTRVFAQLVDDKTALVLGNQITPIEVVLDGKPHQVTVPLEIVAFTGAAGREVDAADRCVDHRVRSSSARRQRDLRQDRPQPCPPRPTSRRRPHAAAK